MADLRLNSSTITALHMAGFLVPLVNSKGGEPDQVPLYILINGQRHALTIDNFQVTDDGSLVFSPDLLLNIERNTSWVSVMAERIRQVNICGFKAEEDDNHADGDLVAAAVSYLELAFGTVDEPDKEPIPDTWPWPDEVWKPSADPRRNLVKALALGLAELERLDRQAVAGEQNHDA